MDAKKILGFVLLKPAMSARNLTSLMLVALFFGVYVMAGGRIEAVPKVDTSASFGGIKQEGISAPAIKQPIARERAQTAASLDSLREQSRRDRGSLFDDSVANSAINSELEAERPLNGEPANIKEGSAQAGKKYSDIEERLKRLK